MVHVKEILVRNCCSSAFAELKFINMMKMKFYWNIVLVLVLCSSSPLLAKKEKLDAQKAEQLFSQTKKSLEQITKQSLLEGKKLKKSLESLLKNVDEIEDFDKEFASLKTLEGMIYQELGKTSKAEKLYKRALDLNHRDAEALAKLAEIELLKENFIGATFYSERSLAYDKQATEPWRVLCQSYYHTKKYEDSIKACKKHMTTNPFDPDVYGFQAFSKVKLDYPSKEIAKNFLAAQLMAEKLGLKEEAANYAELLSVFFKKKDEES